MQLEQCQQEMRQLHLNDRQFYCLPRHSTYIRDLTVCHIISTMACKRCKWEWMILKLIDNGLALKWHHWATRHLTHRPIGRFSFLKLILRIDVLIISRAIALRWMPQELTNDSSILVQVIAWCCQATSHCLGQCLTIDQIYVDIYAITRPQWVNSLKPDYAYMHQWTMASLHEAKCLNGANTLPELMLTHCQLDTEKQMLVKFASKHTLFSSTYWEQVTYICVSKQNIIASDNGLAVCEMAPILSWPQCAIENSICKISGISFRPQSVNNIPTITICYTTIIMSHL